MISKNVENVTCSSESSQSVQEGKDTI